jgi:hypothetical protein
MIYFEVEYTPRTTSEVVTDEQVSPSTKVTSGEVDSDHGEFQVERRIPPLPPILFQQALKKEQQRLVDFIASVVAKYFSIGV